MIKHYALPIFTAVLCLAATGAEAINTLDIDQEGSDHRAFIEQATTYPYDADGNLATITQAGRGQVGEILQRTGSDNEAHIKQEGYGTLNFPNHAKIDQSSHHNLATIVQEFSEKKQSFNNNQAEIEQRSGYNEAHILQVGNLSDARIEQETGTWNKATIDQGKKGNNSKKNYVPDEPCNDCEASILQSGEGNEASIVQRGLDGLNGGDLLATITQLGDENIASISQYGYGNTATIGQYGNYNDATIGQYGNDNTATIEQNGDYNTGSIMQTGDSNEFTLTQNGDGLNFSIVQDGGLVDSIIQTSP